MTSLPLERATVLICSSSWGVNARRVLGNLRGFGDPVRRTGGWMDQPVGDRAVVDRVIAGDHMLAGVTAVAAVAPRPRGGDHLMLHSFDVGAEISSSAREPHAIAILVQ